MLINLAFLDSLGSFIMELHFLFGKSHTRKTYQSRCGLESLV